MRSSVAVAVLCLVGLSAVACSGHPVSVQVSSSPASSTTAAGISFPMLDLGRLDACGVLPNSVLQPVMGAVKSRKPSTGATGPACMIAPVDAHRVSVSVLVYPHLGQQPDQLYASAPQHPYFARITLDGYPATHDAQAHDGPQTGECGTTFSATPAGAVEVYVVTSDERDPHYTAMCTVSDTLARELITRAPKG